MVRLPACLGIALAAALAGCSGLRPPLDHEVAPVVGPPPRLNTTPMAAALACLRAHHPPRSIRIGVSNFVDGTGAMEGGTQYSHAITQRPDLMMITALAAAGAHLVNRSSVAVTQWEMNEAMHKKLGDGHSRIIDHRHIAFRPIRAGIILGSTDYVTGAVTELNWNIDSGVAEAGAYSVGVGRRTYRISIAVDVVVTNTQTTEIVFAKSYKKQLVGFEATANFFRFVNENTALQILSLGSANAAAAVAKELELFDANLDEKRNEPTQTALRWVIEVAAYDIMRHLTHVGRSCDALLPPNSLHDGTVSAEAASGVSPPSFVDQVSGAAPGKTPAKAQRAMAQNSKAAEKTAAKPAAAVSPPMGAAVGNSSARSAPRRRGRSFAFALHAKTRSARSPKSGRMPQVKPDSDAATAEARLFAKPAVRKDRRKDPPSTEGSRRKARPPAPVPDGGAPLRWVASAVPWMRGAVPALQPQLSRAGVSGDTQ